MENKEKKTDEFEGELSPDLLEQITGGNSRPFEINSNGFACPYCPMGFCSNILLAQHIDVVHPDKQPFN